MWVILTSKRPASAIFAIRKKRKRRLMKFKYYPDKPIVDSAIQSDDPLLLLVGFDESKALVANIDDALEHSVLLKRLGYKETEIDGFFRVVLNRQGADWTFICPSDYKGISDRDRRIETFYNDGIQAISKAVGQLGYDVKIDIPARYRRHFDRLGSS
jgi:hypothetical protein